MSGLNKIKCEKLLTHTKFKFLDNRSTRFAAIELKRFIKGIWVREPEASTGFEHGNLQIQTCHDASPYATEKPNFRTEP